MRIGDGLHVHAVASVLVGVIGASVAEAVALAVGAVQEHVVRVVLAQGLEQARRPVGEEPHDGGGVGVGGAYGYAEPGGDLRESVVPAQAGESDEGSLVRRELAAAVTLTGDDEHRDPLDQGVRQVECGRIGNQQGSCTGRLRLRTPHPTGRGPCPLRAPRSSPDRWPR